jgi:hypothetical protein
MHPGALLSTCDSAVEPEQGGVRMKMNRTSSVTLCDGVGHNSASPLMRRRAALSEFVAFLIMRSGVPKLNRLSA